MIEDFEIWSYENILALKNQYEKISSKSNFKIFYHENYSFRILFQMFLGCHINIFQMYWGVSRPFLVTSGAT
jgi:hypothetical protein